MRRLLRTDRLLGVDVARGVALLGMMSVHIVPSTSGPDGDVTLAYEVASGRASALFALLAGVSLALVTGGPRPFAGERLAAARRSVVLRAGVIAVIGLTLAALPSGVAVILVNYGLLFGVATLFLGLGPRVLAGLAAGWLVLAPVVAHGLRGLVGPGPGPSPGWVDLFAPVDLLERLVLTGYYPVLQWTGYLLAGLAVGRLPLRRVGTAVWLAVSGAVLAGLSKAVSGVLLAPNLDQLVVPPTSPISSRPLELSLQTGMYGTTPTTSWWWLAVSGPHSGTPFDMVHTTGTALGVLGSSLLLAHLVGRWLLPLAATGSMTLTLYTLHVVVLAATAGISAQWEPAAVWAAHAVGAVVLASLWALTGWRGPLEHVTSVIAQPGMSGVSGAPRR